MNKAIELFGGTLVVVAGGDANDTNHDIDFPSRVDMEELALQLKLFLREVTPLAIFSGNPLAFQTSAKILSDVLGPGKEGIPTTQKSGIVVITAPILTRTLSEMMHQKGKRNAPLLPATAIATISDGSRYQITPRHTTRINDSM